MSDEVLIPEPETDHAKLIHQSTRGHLVVVENVYHQQPSEQPTSVDSRFSRTLETREQVYVRRTIVTEAWSPLDVGWLRGASMMVVSHGQAQPLLVYPTDEERKQMSQVRLELALEVEVPVIKDRDMHSPPKVQQPPLTAFLSLPPGESARFQPTDLSMYRVRCVGDCEAKCVLTLFPE